MHILQLSAGGMPYGKPSVPSRQQHRPNREEDSILIAFRGGSIRQQSELRLISISRCSAAQT